MKWDYAAVTVWGLDDVDPDGETRYLKSLAELAHRLGLGDDCLEKIAPHNGYAQGWALHRAGERLVSFMTAGAGSAMGSSFFECASTAHEVYPVLQGMFPRHNVARLDAAEDFTGDGAWDRLEAMLAAICGKHRVCMAPWGAGHPRPDGTRDATQGRTWYCGSKDSAFRIVLYEKGLEQIAKGVPADPTWVRLEVRVRPKSKAKAQLGAASLEPQDLLGMSGWGMDVARALGVQQIERLRIGSVWKPNDQEQLALRLVRMFDRGLEQLLASEGSPEAVGRLLFDVQAKAREAKGLQHARKEAAIT